VFDPTSCSKLDDAIGMGDVGPYPQSILQHRAGPERSFSSPRARRDIDIVLTKPDRRVCVVDH
jgi:hypothetical protein